MSIKLIAVDIDGTLVNSNYAKKSLQLSRYKQAGVRFVLQQVVLLPLLLNSLTTCS